MVWVFINPFNLLLFFFLIGLIFLLIKKYKIALFILLINFFIIFTISFFPIGKYLTYLLEKDYHAKIELPKKIDGIMILGGATNAKLANEYNQINVNDASERLIESLRLINKFNEAKIVFSGGSGSINKTNYSHAQIAKNFYEIAKIDTTNIIFEDKSRNTFENILFTSKIVKPKSNEKWILITSAFHMKRAIFIAEKINWKFIPYAVDFKTGKKISLKPNLNLYNNFSAFQKISHEWIGLTAYFLMGRTNSIF